MAPITIKVTKDEQIRRFTLDDELQHFEDLRSRVCKVFAMPAGNFKLKYKDDEGDEVCCSDDEEMVEAVNVARAATPAVLRLILVPHGMENGAEPMQTAAPQMAAPQDAPLDAGTENGLPGEWAPPHHQDWQGWFGGKGKGGHGHGKGGHGKGGKGKGGHGKGGKGGGWWHPPFHWDDQPDFDDKPDHWDDHWDHKGGNGFESFGDKPDHWDHPDLYHHYEGFGGKRGKGFGPDGHSMGKGKGKSKGWGWCAGEGKGGKGKGKGGHHHHPYSRPHLPAKLAIFLANHPKAAAQLAADPTPARTAQVLSGRPRLARFAAEHPGTVKEMLRRMPETKARLEKGTAPPQMVDALHRRVVRFLSNHPAQADKLVKALAAAEPASMAGAVEEVFRGRPLMAAFLRANPEEVRLALGQAGSPMGPDVQAASGKEATEAEWIKDKAQDKAQPDESMDETSTDSEAAALQVGGVHLLQHDLNHLALGPAGAGGKALAACAEVYSEAQVKEAAVEEDAVLV